jgi:two-component system response regulator MprA
MDGVKPPFTLGRILGRLFTRRNPEALRFADVTLDLVAHEVWRGPRRIELSPTEFALLELFLRNPERALTHAEIFYAVWGFDFGGQSNLLNVYMGYLRRKLEEGGEARLVQTIRGFGYVLRKTP